MNGQNRKEVSPGIEVHIVLKQDQRTGKVNRGMASISNGKETLGAYSISRNGVRSRIGRRNDVQANITLPDGSILFAQPEYLNPYVIRSDLFLQKNGKQTRLTRGARLTTPDVSASGRIVAV